MFPVPCEALFNVHADVERSALVAVNQSQLSLLKKCNSLRLLMQIESGPVGDCSIPRLNQSDSTGAVSSFISGGCSTQCKDR